MVVPIRTAGLFVVLFTPFALGCAEKPAPPADPTPAPITRPAPMADRSLTPEEYIELGMAAHDRKWMGPDVTKALAVLGTLAKDDPAKLPRAGSPKSGKVLARITSSENLDFYRNRSLPLASRLATLFEHFQSLNGITKLYLTADPKVTTFKTESVELMGAMLRLTAVVLALSEEFLQTLDPNDVTYPTRKRGLEGLRQSSSTIVQGALIALTEADAYSEVDRLRLLGYVEETLPDIVPHMPPGSRAEVPVRLRELAADPRLVFAKDRLHALRERLAAK